MGREIKKDPLTFVCWKWRPLPGAPNQSKKRSPFTSKHVNALFEMLTRHMSAPFRLICVTDDSEGIDSKIEVTPLWDDFREMGGCFVRLKVFKKDFDLFGPCFISIDLDCVVIRDLAPLFRRNENFVMWKPKPSIRRPSRYCGSLWMLKAGSYPEIYDKFNPKDQVLRRNNRYRGGTDQMHISRLLDRSSKIATWDARNGICNFVDDFVLREGAELSPQTRIVFFNGRFFPDDTDIYEKEKYAWVKEHYPVEPPTLGRIPEEQKIEKVAKLRVIDRPIAQRESPDYPSMSIVTFCWGDWLGDALLQKAYVQRLIDSVARHVPADQKYSFIVFTDNRSTTFDRAESRYLACDSRWNLKKMFMYSPRSGLSSPTICFDLDCVIVGSLAPMVGALRANASHLITCEAVYNPGLAGGSVIGFTPSTQLEEKLWLPLVKNKKTIEDSTRGSERRFYRMQLGKGGVKFWDRTVPGAVASYKRDCREKGAYPNGTAVVRFHGKPRPHEVKEAWVGENWSPDLSLEGVDLPKIRSGGR